MHAQPAPRENWDVTQARGKTRNIDFETDEGTWMTVSPSPDGKTLFFDLLNDIYSVPTAGGEARRVIQNSGVSLNVQPAVSPDGKRIAFISDRGGQNNLWVMDIDGSNPRCLEQNLKVRHATPAWMPDSSFIVARRSSTEEGNARELWMYHVNGGKGVQLTKNADLPGANDPSVSADGRYLFFSVDVAGITDPARGKVQLRRLDLKEGGILKITEGSERGPGGDARLSSGGGFSPRISPDGKSVAFARRLASGTLSFKGHQLGPRTALWIRDLDTGAERLILDPLDRDLLEHASSFGGYLPGYAWDASGRYLFVGQGGKLRKVDASTGKVETVAFRAKVSRTISEQVYAPFRIEDREPLQVKYARWHTISPDQKHLAFQAVGRIWIADLPGGTPHRITPASFTPHEYAPTWSPDGQTVAFTGWSDETRGQLYKVAAGGGTPQQITTAAAEYLNPVWTPDGKSIVVVRSSGATLRGEMLVENNWYDLCLVPGAGGEAKTIVTVNPPGGRISHRRLIVSPSFGPDARLFYPETTGEGRASRTEIKSIRTDGMDKRTHTTLPFADEVAVSPDGRWLAFEEGDNIFMTPMPPGIGDKPVEIRRETNSALPITQVSDTGGNSPRWLNATALSFGSADKAFVYDVATRKTTPYAFHLQVPRAHAGGVIALTGARVITMSGDQVIEKADIVIADGRISGLGRSGSVNIPAGAKRIDLTGKSIIPGLVDLHTHNHRSPSGILPQHDYEMAAVLAYGVTTTLDPGSFSQNIFPQAEMVEAGEIVGPRVYTTGDPLYAGDGSHQNELKNLEQTRQEIRRLKSYGAVSIKQYLQPERRQRQWVSQVAREEGGVMVTAEGGDLSYILTMIMDGQTGWEHPIPNVPLYRDAAEFLGRAGSYYSATLVVAGPGPWNDGYFLQDNELWQSAKLKRFNPWQKFEAHTRRTEERPPTDYTFPMLAQGMADIISAGGYGAIGAHGQMHGIASHWETWMVASAMKPLEALRVATLDGAKMIGVQQDIGSLEVGKLADLVVLNGNPLDDIHQTANIAYVMKGGTLYNSDTLDEIWPREKRYGRFFWEMDQARPNDVKVVK
jgi:Tol biopolymer transport system component/imidazolonepropionase-like amidohydrolase